MDVTRLGIIGVGGFGRFCLEEYLRMPEVRVTAIAGTNPAKYARLAEQYAIPYFTTDWRLLVTRPDVDLIHLATPPDLRAEITIAAAEAGKHIFCEKPLALTLEAADAMLLTAQQHHVKVGINYVMRYAQLYDLVETIITEGLLGTPQRVAFENLAGDLPAEHWFWDPQRSGSILVEHGVHFFDIFTHLLGQGTLQWATCDRRESGQDDKWLVMLRYLKHAFATLYHAFNKPSAVEQTTCLIDFERGRLVLEGWIPERLQLDGVVTADQAVRLSQLLPSATMLPLHDPPVVVRANGQLFPVSYRLSAAFSPGTKQAIYAQAVRDAMQDFIHWTRDSRHTPRVTGEDGRASLALAFRAKELAERMKDEG